MKFRFSSRFYLAVGLVGSIVVGIGEYLLHFNPTGPAGEIEMLLHVPLDRARVGHFFSLIGIPFYFAGYYGLLKLFRDSHELYAKLLFISGILSFTYGGIWLSSRYYAAVTLQKTIDSPLYQTFYASYDENYQVLVWALRVLILLVSLFYVLSILKNQIGLPKWLAALNPIVLLGIIISSLVWFKPLGVQIAPIAMNVTHFIFFGVLMMYSKVQPLE